MDGGGETEVGDGGGDKGPGQEQVQPREARRARAGKGRPPYLPSSPDHPEISTSPP